MMAKIDLASYLPTFGSTSINKFGGIPHTRHTFIKNATWLNGLYSSMMNQKKPGSICAWVKEYYKEGVWTTETYGILFIGEDGSVTEVGDWLMQSNNPNRAFGYQKYSSSEPCGLIWAGVGGLTMAADGSEYAEMDIADQASNGQAYTKKGCKAYSKCAAIEVLPSMEIDGVVYQDVLHLGMYHGTYVPSYPNIQQSAKDMPFLANGMYHLSVDGWNTYAMELWIAKGVGVVKEVVPYIEDGSYWGYGNNIGRLYATPGF